jgi:hypothetical protein
MSILSTKQQKSQGLIDPIFILFSFALVLLLIFATSTGNMLDFLGDALGSINNAPTSLSLSNQASFAADQQYWDANCTRGWSSDSMCEEIVLRSQSCSISAGSAYCSEYATYLQQLNK